MVFRLSYYCGQCAGEANEGRNHCVHCGSKLETRAEGRRLTAILLNEMANLVRDGVISSSAYLQIHSIFVPRLGAVQTPPAAVERPIAPPPVRRREPSRPAPVPAWLVQQAPNLLLYLGAFLTVIAALVFVSARGGDISGGAKLAMLAGYTTAFVIVGAFCYRVPRIRVAGYTFVALSALLVPLNFAAAYNFVLEHEGVDANVVWLSASLYSCLFYMLLAALGLGILYGFLWNAALVSAVAAATVVIGVPAEWTPPVFAVLGICLLPVAWYAPARVRDTFRLPSMAVAHLLIPASILAVSVMLALPASELGREADEEALPITLALAGGFLVLAGMYYRRHEFAPTYGYAACAAFTASLASGLVVADFPFEWIPAVFVGFASMLVTASLFLPERFRLVLAEPASVVARQIAAMAAVAAPVLAVSVVDADRIAVPVTLVLALAFFFPLSLIERERRLATVYEVAVLSLVGGALLSVPFVFEKGAEFYSAAFAGIAGLYVAGALAPVERRRFRADLLWVFALASATAAWLPFLGVFEWEPWFGAGAAWGAAAVYLTAALGPHGADALRSFWRLLVAEEKDAGGFQADWLLLLPCAAMLGLGHAYVLEALAPDLAPDAIALRFLPFPLAFAIAGMAVGRWSRLRSRVLYVAALGYSLFVTVVSYGDWGQMAIFLAIFAAVAAVVAVREREPRGSYVSLSYAVFALVFALVHWQPVDQVWTIPFVTLSLLVYTAALISAPGCQEWSRHLVRGSFATALVAPAVGFGLLAYGLAEASRDGVPIAFSDPPLYLWSTGTVAIVGVLAAIEAVRSRTLALAYGSSLVLLATLLLVIGYFRPENPQAYTVPVAIYLLALVLSAGRRGARLSEDVRILLAWTEVLAVGILLGTTLLQATGETGLTYHFVLLGESIAYLLLGLVMRRKLMVVPALAFTTVAAGLFAFEGKGGGALPSWAILAMAGGALLALGFLFLVRLDLWQRIQRSAEAWWRGWEEA